LHYLTRASFAFGVLLLLASVMTRVRMIQPNGADAVLNDEGESSREPEIDEARPVLCSLELNVYCPPKTRCCPRYRQLFTERDGRDNALITPSVVGYTCLTSSSGHNPPGLCCADEREGAASGSGCAVGYTCAAPKPSAIDSSTIDNKEKMSSLLHVPHCVRDDSSNPFDLHGHPIDNKYELMPRYRTCPAFAMKDITTPFGLPIPLSAASYHNLDKSSRLKSSGGSDGVFIGQLAYFTNMGPLVASTSSAPAPVSNVKTAVVAIHGSGRDALSYLCAIIAAVAEVAQHAPVESSSTLMEDVFHSLDSSRGDLSTIDRRHLRLQNKGGEIGIGNTISEEGDILTIAPWFLAPADGQPDSTSSLPFLQWNDDYPIEHTFRYGAESREVPVINNYEISAGNSSISSFAVLDVLLETLCNKTNYPQLDRIIVVGHSAGGQTVHRWGVTSDSWCFGDGSSNGTHPPANLPLIRLVSANPRNYAYLDKRRYFPTTSSIVGDGTEALSPFDKLEFRLPTESEFNDCQEYDKYIWGMEDNPRIHAPYVSSRVQNLMESGDDGRTKLFCRYASRDVVYLSGERDEDELSNQIADGDGYQGPSRRERSERFYASLQVLGGENLGSCTRSREYLRNGLLEHDDEVEETTQVHSRFVVNNVGHDHSLLFQSREGLKSMFTSV
jgi:hypothetical protein